jgi:hypothetical protein
MNTDGLTPESIRLQNVDEISRGRTFKPQGISEQTALDYLRTDEGAMYYQHIAESAAPGTTAQVITDRAVGQLMSGRELPSMETINLGEPLVKFVAEGSSPSAFSPYWARESQAESAIAMGKNISDFYGLPIGSEALRYDMYRITPQVPTQVFVSTVAPTSELDNLVTKNGGAEQSLVPNRKLFSDPVYVKTVDNVPSLSTEVGREDVSPNLIRGASALGVAAVAYDATTTATRTSDLLHQGNTTGAQSQVEHFAARNVGGWGSAIAAAEVAGAAGIETGPLDLVISGIAGIGGAVAADKIADWRDQQRIYTQTDPQGTTWHLDPKQPQQGWTRTVQTDQIDAESSRFSMEGMPVYKMRTETAPPAVAERLTFQANNAAVDLALANPPKPQDPYTQPSAPQDTRSFRDAPWMRDAQTQQWSRTVTDGILEHGIASTHVETASPQRTAELNAAAQQTIAQNLHQSPRGIAEHYRATYEQNDWAKYGPMQPSVTNALKAPENTLQASDGKTYTHGTDGQWTTPGLLWGTNAAEGNIRAELNATAQMAASQKQPPAQSVPQATVKTAPEPPPPIPEHLRDFRHPDHPMNGTYQTMLGHVHAMENANGIRHGEHSERTAAVLADRQSADRLGYVKQVELHDNGRHTDIHLVTRDPAHSSAQPDRVTSIRSDDAIAKPVEQVSHDWSRRELPHIYQHQVREPEPPARDPSTLQADDPRRMDHPRHAQFDALRERIGAAYAQYGIVRSEGQLDRATAAVMLDLQKNDAHWQMPDRVKLTVDPQTGKAGPGSGIMTDNTQSLLHNMTVTQGAAMQQAPEASFQQMNQVAQQQTQQAQIQAAQTQRQQQGPAL